MAEPGVGMALLTFGFVFAFVGYAGWHNPRSLARTSNTMMRTEETQADVERQEGYGKLVAGLAGAVGVAMMAWGLYAFLTNVF